MKTRTLYIAAYTLDDAVVFAQAIEEGRMTEQDYHTDEAEAERFAKTCAGIFGRPIPVWPVVVETRAVDDGVITNVWPVSDKVGDAAAAILLFIAAPALAARFWWVFA